jgi:tetratricopeptide (TPR) repeat protein
MAHRLARCFSLCAALAVLALGPAAVAVAQDVEAVARARLRYEEGARLYDQGQYLAAVHAFEEAYRLSQAKPLLFNIAQAYRLLGHGHCAEALAAYERYLAADPFASNRDEVGERILAMRACVAEAGHAPESAAERAPAGAAAQAATPSEREPARAPRRALALGLALGGSLVGLGGLSLYTAARFEYEEQRERCPCPEGKFARWEKLTRTSYALMGVGGSAMAGGLVWLGSLRTMRYSLSVAPWYVRVKGRF